MTIGSNNSLRVGFSLVFIKNQPICRVIKFFVSLVSIQYVLTLIKRIFTPVNMMNIALPGQK